MADDNTDKSQKTEEPTQRRLEDARKKGQVATSRELNNAFMISAAAAFIALLAPSLAEDLSSALVCRSAREKPHLADWETQSL